MRAAIFAALAVGADVGVAISIPIGTLATVQCACSVLYPSYLFYGCKQCGTGQELEVLTVNAMHLVLHCSVVDGVCLSSP